MSDTPSKCGKVNTRNLTGTKWVKKNGSIVYEVLKHFPDSQLVPYVRMRRVGSTGVGFIKKERRLFLDYKEVK